MLIFKRCRKSTDSRYILFHINFLSSHTLLTRNNCLEKKNQQPSSLTIMLSLYLKISLISGWVSMFKSVIFVIECLNVKIFAIDPFSIQMEKYKGYSCISILTILYEVINICCFTIFRTETQVLVSALFVAVVVFFWFCFVCEFFCFFVYLRVFFRGRGHLLISFIDILTAFPFLIHCKVLVKRGWFEVRGVFIWVRG